MNTFDEKLFQVVKDVEEVKSEVSQSSTPNVFYKSGCEIVSDSLPYKATIPICKADSPCFQCKMLAYGNECVELLYAIDAVYMNNYTKFGYVSPHQLNTTRELFKLNASLVKATTTDGQEIICIRLEWSDGCPTLTLDCVIISNQDIAGDDIEVQSETALPNFEFYPVLKDAKKDDVQA